MAHYKYLVIGGGMTGSSALSGIREIDVQGSIGMIGAEPHMPYDRPPLSKALWKGDPVEKIWRDVKDLGVDFLLGRTAVELVADGRGVIDDRGETHTCEKLLLATGGTPRRLPFGEDEIIYYRTFDDYERLRVLAGRYRRFAVIGGGFIGSEIAAALAMNGRQVVMFLPEDAICARIFPPDHAAFITEYYRSKGVDIRTRTVVEGCERRGDVVRLRARDGSGAGAQEIDVDAVVAGVGIVPNSGLAEAAGIEVGNGIVVDEALRTSAPGIYAAGDVASFHNPALGERIRVEHEDNALHMGAAAGRSMAGEGVRYDHLPFFYSDMFDLGYEAVGTTDARLETYSDWKDPHRTGVIYYLKDGRVRGVVNWNVWEQVDSARTLIAQGAPVRAEELKGRLA